MASKKGTSPFTRKWTHEGMEQKADSADSSDKESPGSGVEKPVGKTRPESAAVFSARAAVVSRLHSLEVANQRLTKEKESLENQLIHVLGRLSAQNYPGPSTVSEAANREELHRFISETIQKIKAQRAEAADTNLAPLAREDFPTSSGSIIGSVSILTAPEYSSLSEAYEEICLGKDLVREINGLESLPSSEQKEKVSEEELPSRQQPTVPDISAVSARAEGRKRRVRAVVHTDVPGTSAKKRASPVARDTLKEAKRRLDRGKRPTIPEWLSPISDVSPQSLLYMSVKRNLLDLSDTESVVSSSRSCSIFSSSSSRSASPVIPPLSPFLRHLAPDTRPKISSSLPTSPLWSSPRIRRIEPERFTAETRFPVPTGAGEGTTTGPYRGAYRPAHRRHPTRQELIAAMPPVSALDGRITADAYLSSVPGPPKVKISRRHLVHPVTVDESSDTTSTTSRPNIPERNFEFFPNASWRLPVSPNRLGFLRSNRYQQVIETMPQTINITPLSYEPCPLTEYSRRRENRFWRPLVQIGSSVDFLNEPLVFRQFLPQNCDMLLTPKDITILTFLSKLVCGLDAFTCSQGQTLLLQRLQPPFATATPIIASTEAYNHSHESSDLTSELSANIPLIADPKTNVVRSGAAAVTSVDGKSAEKPEVNSKIDSGSTLEEKSREKQKPQEPSTSRKLTGGPVLEPVRSEDKLIIHEAVLFRLSNRMKIWRRYLAILNPSSILFHTSESPLRPPKRSILLSSIRSIRKPFNLSASVTAGMGLSTFIEGERENTEQQHRNGSVPVTRKFAHYKTDLMSRTNFGHFELILASGKTHRLRGTNANETDLWMRHIKRTLRAVQAREIVETHGAQLVTQGWLLRIKGGESCWVWCRLMGHYLIYAQSPECPAPTGFKSLRSTYIRTVHTVYPKVPNLFTRELATTNLVIENEGVENPPGIPQGLTSSSDSDTLATGDSEIRDRTIALWTDNFDPIYLVCRNNEEFETWRDNLTRACQQFRETVDYSLDPVQAQLRLREYWRVLVRQTYANDLYHTDEMIRGPISRTTELSQLQACTRLFSLVLFLSYPKIDFIETKKSRPVRVPMSTVLNSPHWLTIKHLIITEIAKLCFNSPGLKDELFLQLVKQSMLSDAQTKRMLKRHLPQRTRVPQRGFSLWCSRSHTTEELEGRRQTKTSPSSFSEPEESEEVGLFLISGECSAYLSDVAKRMKEGPNLIFPTSSSSVSSRPEGWWPVLAVWEGLSLLLPLFLPSAPVLTCLQLLISIYHEMDETARTSSSVANLFAELSRYAAFCRETLGQTVRSGGRFQVPSALEIASISIRNPYTHSYPFSIPIHLPNGNAYEVVSFNGGSEFTYVIQQLLKKLGLAEAAKAKSCMFCICLRLSRSGKPYRCAYLKPEWKMCDVISLYEQAILSLSNKDHKNVRLEDATAELVFRIQAFSWKKLKTLKTSEVRPLIHLLTHQLHEDLLSGAYQVMLTGGAMLDLAAYLCRVDHYDYAQLQNRHENTLSQLVNSYFPPDWLSTLSADGRSFIQLKLLLLDRWTWVCKTSEESRTRARGTPVTATKQTQTEEVGESVLHSVQTQACFSYLRTLRNLLPERFGAVAFPAQVFDLSAHTETQLIWIVPQEEKIRFLVAKSFPVSYATDTNFNALGHPRALTCVQTIQYNSILSFGGQRSGAFFIVYLERISKREGDGKSAPETTRMPWDASAHVGGIKPTISNETDAYQNLHLREVGGTYPVLRKLRIHLTDLNAVMELTDILEYFINLTH
ncbi:unnamed protein product [Calicophoron daubneyi]|uniref:PH domain-containing protein n=1 Tax=Calicophoron daubneyi TaxID=300641 RepID=A0AAV2T594_CALDB